MFSMRTRALALAAAAATLAACSDSTAPEPATLDGVLGDVAAIEEYAAMGALAGGAPGLPSHGAAWDSCTYTASSQSFVCAPVTSGGMTMTRSFQLLNAAGTPQSAFNPATINAVRTTLDVSGSLQGSSQISMAMEHHSEQTVGGLLGATRSVNGQSSTRTILVSGASTDTLHTTTTTALTLPRPTSAAQRVYPTGTVTTVMTGGGAMGAGVSMTTTFNGTSTATISMSLGGGLTSTCTVNLDVTSQRPICS